MEYVTKDAANDLSSRCRQQKKKKKKKNSLPYLLGQHIHVTRLGLLCNKLLPVIDLILI